MKKLTDVYIKVTKGNKEELYTLLNRKIRVGYFLYFLSDDIKTSWLTPDIQLNKQKVSLSQLKRLINTIPTREEITRLKRQISAYKTNYDRAVKHSLSKEDVIEDLQRKLNRERITITDLFKQRKEVQLNHCKQIHTLAEEVKRLKSENQDLSKMYDDLLVENAKIKQRKWWQIWK